MSHTIPRVELPRDAQRPGSGRPSTPRRRDRSRSRSPARSPDRRESTAITASTGPSTGSRITASGRHARDHRGRVERAGQSRADRRARRSAASPPAPQPPRRAPARARAAAEASGPTCARVVGVADGERPRAAHEPPRNALVDLPHDVHALDRPARLARAGASRPQRTRHRPRQMWRRRARASRPCRRARPSPPSRARRTPARPRGPTAGEPVNRTFVDRRARKRDAHLRAAVRRSARAPRADRRGPARARSAPPPGRRARRA